jgi:hypothetical protein
MRYEAGQEFGVLDYDEFWAEAELVCLGLLRYLGILGFEVGYGGCQQPMPQN